MSEEQIQAWEQFQEAAQAAWEAIAETVRAVVALVIAIWRSIPRRVRQSIILRTQPIMRRKIRRYYAGLSL